jgi:hypothetical protein
MVPALDHSGRARDGVRQEIIRRKGCHMAHWKLRGAGILAVSLLGSTAVFADVTPEEVWANWSKSYDAFGYDIKVGSEDRSGDTLTLKDVVMMTSTPEATTVMTVPEMRFRDAGDGTVEVTTAETMDIDTKAKAQGQSEEVDLNMQMRQKDMVAIVSGTPDNLAYDMTAPEIVIEMDQVITNGETQPVKMQMTLLDSTGLYGVEQRDGQKITSDFKTGTLRFTVSGADPQDGATFNMTGDLADLVLGGDMFVPEGVDMEDPGVALEAGMTMDFDVNYGQGTYAIDGESPDGPFKINAAAESGTFALQLSQDGFSYVAGGKAADMSMLVPDFPMPLSVKLAETITNFTMPLAATEEPAPFNAVVKLVGLEVSEELWAMFDPSAKLPRDPASLIIDLSGMMRPLVDLFSAEAAEADVPPVEVQSLDVNDVQLSVAGTELTGKGAVTFDNSMGMPMPLGEVNLRLVGANALMDNLVAMGLRPEDQVMFARMMLGLYAVPSGDDELTSKIEFQEGGKILANGQQVQ